MGKKERFYLDLMATNPEVTGSCNLGIVKLPDSSTIRFVVDCGMFQEKDYDEYNSKLPFDSENIDFCIVTHNHVDHTGRLPLMVKMGYDKKIYATEDTCRLMPMALHDSLGISKDIAKRKHERCIYSEENVDKALALLQPCEFEKTIKVHNNVKVTFFVNGHLPGAALVLVQIHYPGYEDINLLFTGDYNNKNMFFDVTELPEWVLELPLTIVQESTYGNMESTEITSCFKENIQECITEGGTAIVLAFALGRTQEILYELKKMQEAGELDKKIPIYLDGKLAIRYTRLYLNGALKIKPEMLNFAPENLILVKDYARNEVLYSDDTKIIVTTSGMGSHGPAPSYISEYISRKKALIQFTGYTAEGTLGRKLKNAESDSTVEVRGIITKKRAKVEYTTEYSAHAKADEMIKFLQQFKHLKFVLINHGESNVKEQFAERVLDEVETKNIGILDRQYFFRINPYGLVKTLSTKFD